MKMPICQRNKQVAKKKDKEQEQLREIIEEEKDMTIKPMELRNNEVCEEYKDIIASYSTEMDRIEYEKKMLYFLPVLKQKFVYLYCSGMYRNQQIARILDVHPGTITNWLKLDEIKTAIEAYQKEENIIVDSSLKAIRMKAVNKLSDLLEAKNELVALQATKEILDRTGHMAVQKQEININMTYEERLRNLITQDIDFVVIDDDTQNNTEGSVQGDA